MMNKKNIFICILMLFLTCMLKSLYASDIRQDLFFYKVLIMFSNDIVVNIVWLIPIIYNIIIISKDMYYELINFNVRYKCRFYFSTCVIKKYMLRHFFLCSFIIIFQYIYFILILKYPILINDILFIVFIKYLFEIYLIEIIIVIVSLKINNYIYSFISILFILLVFINFFKVFYIPFVTLYVNYKINFFDFGLIFVLLSLIVIIYKNKDLGGVNCEING